MVNGACSVTRSGNTLTIKMPSKNVSISLTANEQHGDTAPINGVSILSMLDSNHNIWQMTYNNQSGTTYKTGAIMMGDKSYTCINY